ncbi:transcriptional regulator [Labrys miyagiensis]|uniref:Transcriptional regulator n=1 Tax=Labrys miyagiensis TaxID=346912 RepID=A0ABQ6CGL0_9HYPH|nr:metalloregulator ArsR/SmtB family transcription factor [Labrys miyagiensis]GLS19050.1 transcriptional regulator [Labrys miyagiensis]
MAADKVFEALSSVPRRRMLAYLSKTDMTAGQIVERFADVMSAPAVSKHLSILENAGLVWREKRGQNVHYGLRDDTLAGTLMQFLSEICPGSRPYTDDSRLERIRRNRRPKSAEDKPEKTGPATADPSK